MSSTDQITEDTPATQNIHSYTVVVTYDPSDGTYYANIPALHTVTDGDTLEEAYAMAEDAISLWIQSAIDLGEDLPANTEVVGIKDIAPIL